MDGAKLTQKVVDACLEERGTNTARIFDLSLGRFPTVPHADDDRCRG